MKKLQKINKVLLIFLILFFTIIFAKFLIYSYHKITNTCQLESEEGNIISISTHFNKGYNIYSSLYEEPTYFVTTYTPVYYMIFGFLIKIFKHELITGRIFSFICSLLVSILIYAILYKKTKDILISILTSLIYFSFGLINYWSTITRMDIFSVLLSLIGIYLITNYNNKKKFYTSISV